MDPQPHQITQLLQAWSKGDKAAFAELVPLVYDHLHGLAQCYMAQERRNHTLQPTALVHEAYLRMLDAGHPSWQDRAHFFTVCARVMRRILVDWARSRQMLKRHNPSPLPVLEAVAVGGAPDADLVALDDALTALAAVDPRKSQIVEMRFFGGLTASETAEVLKVSEETVLRDWKLAKGWLRRELRKDESHETEALAGNRPDLPCRTGVGKGRAGPLH